MSALEEFAAKQGAKPSAKKQEWTPPSAADFALGRVIGIDQSLANCGIVVLRSDTAGVSVFESTTFRTKRVDDGPEDTFRRGELMRLRLTAYLRGYDPKIPVVHEQPLPIQRGMKGQRPESAWIAGAAVRAAAAESGHTVVMLGAQYHKRVTSGLPNGEKTAYQPVLMSWARTNLRGIAAVTNVDERDALSIASAYLLEACRG